MPLSAADRSYEFAKRAILTREYKANTLVTEGEIAAAAGVSRTPVREALLRLQGEGLVRLLPKRGALILAPTAEEAIHTMQIRRMFEMFAVRAAMRGRRDPLIDQLTEQIDRMRQCIKDRDIPNYIAADRAFHTAIIAATDNALMLDLYNGLRDRQLRMGPTLFGAGGKPDVRNPTGFFPEHQAILDAVVKGSIRAAEAAVSAHLDHAEQTLLFNRD